MVSYIDAVVPSALGWVPTGAVGPLGSFRQELALVIGYGSGEGI